MGHLCCFFREHERYGLFFFFHDDVRHHWFASVAMKMHEGSTGLTACDLFHVCPVRQLSADFRTMSVNTWAVHLGSQTHRPLQRRGWDPACLYFLIKKHTAVTRGENLLLCFILKFYVS